MKSFARFLLISAGALALLLSNGAWAAEETWSASFKFKIELRPGVTSYIESIYMLNLSHPSGGKTLLAIPGAGLTASSYRPLVEQLFAAENHSHSGLFSRAVLVDYPGHAGSSLPENDPGADPLLFGDMILEDYVATVLGIMDQLEFLQISADTLVGHCMGGTIIQMAQQRLLAQGTDLRRRYGIKDVVLLAPDPPAQVLAWRSDPASADLSKWTVPNDPVRGTYIKYPAKFVINNMFTNLSGTVVPGAPVEYFTDPSPIANESMMVTLQLFGKPPFPHKPMIDAGIFGSTHRTSLTVVGFSQDRFFTPEGQLGIYKYLTGDPSGGMYSGSRYFCIDSPDAVHGMYYSNPAALLSAGRVFH